MRAALDTNVLVYAEGAHGGIRQKAAIDILRRVRASSIVIPIQVFAEFFQVLVRKLGRTAREAREVVLTWRNYSVVDTTEDVLLAAMDLVDTHRFSLWDAVILASAAESDCRLLLSEDLQEGFVWRGVTVANPFARNPHPLLRTLLNS